MPKPLLSTIEDTMGEERYVRVDANTNQQYLPNQAHVSADQDGTQGSSPVRRSPRIREMLDKRRERNKSNKVFASAKK